MADLSTYKGLELPKGNERYNIEVVNKNNRIIDSELHKLDLKNESQDELLAAKEAQIALAMSDHLKAIDALNAAIGTMANQADMESLLGTKLDKAGDIQNTTVTFTGTDTISPSAWEDFDLIQSGESTKSLFAKLSVIARNLRLLHTNLGGFSLYPDALTQAQYDALPGGTKNNSKMIFIIKKE